MTNRCNHEQVVAYHELPLGPNSVYDPPYEYGSTKYTEDRCRYQDTERTVWPELGARHSRCPI
jgi:hypothetical protein